MIELLGKTVSPEQILQREIERFKATESHRKEIALCFDVDCYWLDDASSVTLLAACLLTKQTDEVQLSVTITDRVEAAEREIRQESPTFIQFCKRQMLSVIDLARPLRLEPLNIPKPWGKEIWYTGIEHRGVCRVEDIPLPWITALYRGAICASKQRELILLKILDPLPTEIEGDLYFEMHREKIEVYIVTHVDEIAWPAGIGKIRYGFDAAQVAKYGSDTEFRSAYLAAVRSYRDIRQRIDAELDRSRQQQGFASNEPIPAALPGQWMHKMPPAWLEQEQLLRAGMDAFTHLQDLKVGDVLQVQPFTPHALQHGVRTIEFQTPHYERQILSFGQKVLTQDHWDTENAVEEMIIQPTQATALPVIVNEAGILLEQVAEFPQFSVQRLTLEPGAHYTFNANRYGLTIGVSGVCLINGDKLESEQAVLIPAYLQTRQIENRSAEKSVCLLAVPSY